MNCQKKSSQVVIVVKKITQQTGAERTEVDRKCSGFCDTCPRNKKNKK